MSDTSKFFDCKKSWSTYKDRLLSAYLSPYFAKILGSGKNTLFIDGFAGRGLFEDGTIGSPLIVKEKALEAMSRSKYNTKIIPIFIEYKKKNARILTEALNCDWCYVRNEDYKKEAFEIICRNKDKNIFLYADPFGIKHIQYNIFEELALNKNSVELLLNLSSFGFIREGCRLLGVSIDNEIESAAGENDTNADDTFINDIDNMDIVANGDYWREIISLLKSKSISGKQAEEMFVDQYLQTLNNDFEYVFQIPIRTGDDKMPKYRMVFATNHIQGALLMSEEMIRCNNEMSLHNHGNQYSLFDYDYSKATCKDDLRDIISKATETEAIIDCKDICMLLYIIKGAKYLHTDIKKALIDLENEGYIQILREKTLTPTGKLSKSFDYINNTIKVRLK